MKLAKRIVIVMIVFSLFYLGIRQKPFETLQEDSLVESIVSQVNSSGKVISDSGDYGTQKNEFDIISDIYKTDPKDLKLALLLPESLNKDDKIPVIIYLHGGAWTFGDRSEIFSSCKKQVQDLQELGFAVISVDYSLVDSKTNFPQNIVDCKDVVRWVYKNAETYHFDVENIGVWGTSAGAHLALMVAYSDDSDFIGDNALKDYSSKVNYVIDFYGPTDLVTLFSLNDLTALEDFKNKQPNIFQLGKRQLEQMTGLDIENNYEEVCVLLEQYSPLTYLDEYDPPTFIAHGLLDELVNIEQSRMLEKDLKNFNVQFEAIYLQDARHGFYIKEASQYDDITHQMIEFIQKQ